MHRTDFDSQRSVTLTEMLSQTAVWQAQFAGIKQSPLIETILQQASSRTEWLFIGCGTSYYLAEAAACTWTMVTGQRARALPASEVLLFCESSYFKHAGLQSGNFFAAR